MAEAPPYPYHLGTVYPVMPVAPVPEHCVPVDAGPLRLVVEARDLRDEAARSRGSATPPPAQTSQFDDFGASLHVCGAADGAEHLRFDCFDKEPHYHYIRNAEPANVIVRLDDVAEGDPIEWTIGRVRSRLPEMLQHAGATDLAAQVRTDPAPVLAALERVRALLVEAGRRAEARRASGGRLAPASTAP
jgi:hypothetical protein